MMLEPSLLLYGSSIIHYYLLARAVCIIIDLATAICIIIDLDRTICIIIAQLISLSCMRFCIKAATELVLPK
jgi:hypothetical protein